MNQEEYIKERVMPQIKWHSDKAIFNKRCYLCISCVSLIISIIVSATIKTHEGISFYLSLLIPLCTGVLGIFNFQNKWNIYRNTSELMKVELALFKTSTGIYSDKQESFNLFVENIEKLLVTNNKRWTETQFNSKNNK